MKFDYRYMDISGGVLCKMMINDCWVRMSVSEYNKLDDWTKAQYEKVKKWCEDNIEYKPTLEGGKVYADTDIADMCDIALYGKVYPYQIRIILAELKVPYKWNNKDIVYMYEVKEVKKKEVKENAAEADGEIKKPSKANKIMM